MATSPEYAEYILNQLGKSGSIRSRKMFGGVGVYVDEVFCAIISSSNIFYLRVGENNIEMFQNEEMSRFPNKKGAGMPYYEVPDFVVEDMDELAVWVHEARNSAIESKK